MINEIQFLQNLTGKTPTLKHVSKAYDMSHTVLIFDTKGKIHVSKNKL